RGEAEHKDGNRRGGGRLGLGALDPALSQQTRWHVASIAGDWRSSFPLIAAICRFGARMQERVRTNVKRMDSPAHHARRAWRGGRGDFALFAPTPHWLAELHLDRRRRDTNI